MSLRLPAWAYRALVASVCTAIPVTVIGAQVSGADSTPPKAQTSAPSKPSIDSVATPRITGSAIRGIVIDSIGMGPLADALVQVHNQPYAITTDSVGAFLLEGLKPGTYRLAVFHPLFDSLHFSVSTGDIQVGSNQVRDVVLATPSAFTLIEKSCPAPQSLDAVSAIFGEVRDPETRQPLDSVKVWVEWTEWVSGKKVGIKREEERRETYTRSDGRYVLCNVPDDITLVLQAEHQGVLSNKIPVDFGRRFLALRNLWFSAQSSRDSTGSSRMFGWILAEEDNTPIANARVSVVGTAAETQTQADGSFELANLPSGTRVVLVRHVSHAYAERPVDLSPQTPAEVTIQMYPQSRVLETVSVGANASLREQYLKKVGFSDRKRRGLGRFLDIDQIAKIPGTTTTALFNAIPTFSASGDSIISRDGCVELWVDGVRYDMGGIARLNATIAPDQVIGIETYRWQYVPAQYGTPRGWFDNARQDSITATLIPPMTQRDTATGGVTSNRYMNKCSVALIWTNRQRF